MKIWLHSFMMTAPPIFLALLKLVGEIDEAKKTLSRRQGVKIIKHSSMKKYKTKSKKVS